jgi:DNA gyrase subunit B
MIEQGRVYIAQPPLFQMARRSKAEYALNEKVLNERLTNMGLEGTTLLVRAAGETDEVTTNVVGEYSGKQLQEMINLIDELELQLNVLRRRGIEVREFLTEHFDPAEGLPKIRATVQGERHFFYNEKQFTQFCKEAETRFGRIELDDGTGANGGVTGEPQEPAVSVIRADLTEAVAIEKIFRSLIKDWKVTVQDYFRTTQENVAGQFLPTRFSLKLPDDKLREIPCLPLIPKTIRDHGATGIEIKRFKGLGEMNPEELWSTTMDPEKRVMRKVTISEEPDDPAQYQIDMRETDRIFSILMGESVEQRRNFIEVHATEVKNLDV